MTVDDAYRIQQDLVALCHADGDETVGYKVGLTASAMQAALGVDSPDYGPVLASMVLSSGCAVDSDRLIAPRIEAEVALLVNHDLFGANVSELDITRSCYGAVAALEIIDSRIRDWRLQLPDTIADLASIGAVVLSSTVVPLDRLTLRTTGMHINLNGEIAATGAGGATLGNPLTAAAWLVRTLATHGEGVEAGQIILTGALHAALPVSPGDLIRAEFDTLGAVECRFEKGPAQ